MRGGKRSSAVMPRRSSRGQRSHLILGRGHVAIQLKTLMESKLQRIAWRRVFPPLPVVLPLQGDLSAVRWAFGMRSLVFLLAGLFASAGLIHGEFKTPENAPIEITSTGQTTYENGLATARDNVVIHIGNTEICADYPHCTSPTRDVSFRGHVRTCPDLSLYTADSRVYHTETK